MFWRVICEESEKGLAGDGGQRHGRFVVHRHVDAYGPHLDIRLEQEGYLLGWRIDGVTLAGEPWATEKAPHSSRWLEQDGDAVREDAGVYAWIERGADRRVLLLDGQRGRRCVRLEREAGLPGKAVRAICEAVSRAEVPPEEAAGLILDGVTARRRAVERFCGLGRELDGSAFDEGAWRKTLRPLTLDEIHGHLRAYEVRFDAKYPARPVSQPEPLGDEGVEERSGAALAIVRG